MIIINVSILYIAINIYYYYYDSGSTKNIFMPLPVSPNSGNVITKEYTERKQSKDRSDSDSKGEGERSLIVEGGGEEEGGGGEVKRKGSKDASESFFIRSPSKKPSGGLSLSIYLYIYLSLSYSISLTHANTLSRSLIHSRAHSFYLFLIFFLSGSLSLSLSQVMKKKLIYPPLKKNNYILQYLSYYIL